MIKHLLFATLMTACTAAAFAQTGESFVEPPHVSGPPSYAIPSSSPYVVPMYNVKSNDKGLPSGNLRELGRRRDDWSDMQTEYVPEDSVAIIYDVNSGKVQMEIHKDYNAVTGEWENNHRYLYAYDPSGWRISYIYDIWDGVSWNHYNRTTYQNDSWGNITLMTSYDWVGGAWEPAYEYQYAYDAAQRETERIIRTWNPGTMSWEPNDRDVYTYDANGRLLTETDYLVSGGAFVENYLETYTYDASGNLLSLLDQNWDNVNNIWVNDYRVLSTYISGNRNNSNRYEQWDNVGNVWDPSGKDTITYAGNTSTNLYDTWNGSAYEPSTRYTTTIVNGNYMLEMYELWDNVEMEYDGDYRYIYTYAGNLQSSYTYEIWDIVNDAWTMDYRGDYFYGANDNPESYVYSIFNTADSVWVYDYRYFYEYNNQNYLTYRQYEDFNDAAMLWVLSDRTYFWYENKPLVGIEDPAAAYQLQVYPNPAEDVLNIAVLLPDNQQLSATLINISGQVVASQAYGMQSGQVTRIFSVNGLSAGSYLLRITAGENSIIQKIIIQ